MRVIKDLFGFDLDDAKFCIKQSLRESLLACPAEYQDVYENISFDEYRPNLISEIWDGDKCLGKGFEFCGKAIIITQENMREFEDIFDDCVAENWNEFINEIEVEY